jgi:hypothetical protein
MAQVYGPGWEHPPSQPYRRLTLREVVNIAADQAGSLTDGTWRVVPPSIVPASAGMGRVTVNAMEFLLLMAEAYLVLYEGGSDEGVLLNVLPSRQWPVVRSVLDLVGRTFTEGDSWSFKPASADLQMDDVPPTVRYVSPPDGSQNVPLSTNITVSFSERMDETLSLDGAVVLDPPMATNARWVYHRLEVEPLEDLADNTTYTVTVRRSFRDPAGNPLAAEVTWSFTTLGLENGLPLLHPWPEGRYVEVEENQTVRLGVLVEDDGPPPLRYRWLRDGVALAGEVGDSIELLTTYSDAGEHTVTVIVSDGAGPPGTSSFTWNLTVVNVNLPPVLRSVDPDVGAVDLVEQVRPFRFTVRAEDPDEGVVEYSWNLNGRPVPEEDLEENGAVYALPLGFNSAGEHTVTCRVKDDTGEGFELEWLVTVADVNVPPVINDVEPATPPTVEAGQTVDIRVNATDVDEDPLEYTWFVDLSNMGTTGEGSWQFTSLQGGSFDILIVVEDGRGGRAETHVTVNVLPQQQPQPPPVEPSLVPWLLVLVVAAVLVVAVLWPRLRRGEEGQGPPED